MFSLKSGVAGGIEEAQVRGNWGNSIVIKVWVHAWPVKLMFSLGITTTDRKSCASPLFT